MDYGKLAYMKAEELEARLQTPAAQGAASAGFSPDAPCDGLELTEIRVSGSAVVLVKAVLYAPAATTATVTLTLDGLTVADATVTLTAGVRCAEILMGCVELNGVGTLRLNCDDAQVRVERVEIGLVGANAGVTREASDFRFARYGAGGLAGVSNSQTITVYPVDNGIGEGMALCRGSSFDLAATPDGYAVLNCDLVGNLWFRMLDFELNQSDLFLVGSAVKSPTLCYVGGRLIGAGIENGGIVTFSIVENAVRSSVSFAGKVDAVYFVKDAPKPILAVTSAGKVFIKTASDIPMGTENISVKPQLYAVSDKEKSYTWN